MTVFLPSKAFDVLLNSAELRQVKGNSGSVVEEVLMVIIAPRLLFLLLELLTGDEIGCDAAGA
jgi:hypothetical protein